MYKLTEHNYLITNYIIKNKQYKKEKINLLIDLLIIAYISLSIAFLSIKNLTILEAQIEKYKNHVRLFSIILKN